MGFGVCFVYFNFVGTLFPWLLYLGLIDLRNGVDWLIDRCVTALLVGVCVRSLLAGGVVWFVCFNLNW